MSIRKSPRGQWMIDVKIKMPDGSITRVRKVCPVQTKRGTDQYEREVRRLLLDGDRGSKEGGTHGSKDEEPAPKLAKFAAFFIDTYATTNNRPSTVREKRRALRRGMLDLFGHLRLDQIGARQIEAYKARRKDEGAPATAPWRHRGASERPTNRNSQKIQRRRTGIEPAQDAPRTPHRF